MSEARTQAKRRCADTMRQCLRGRFDDMGEAAEMSAQKYGGDASGAWDRDENNLPCYVLEPPRLPRACPPLWHVVGTGRLTLLADQFGRMHMFTSELGQACCLGARGPSFCSALYGCVTHASGWHSLLLSEIPASGTPAMRWGLGYVQYEGSIMLDPQLRLSTTLEIAAPLGQTFLVANVTLRNEADETLSLDVEMYADLNPAPAVELSDDRQVFTKDGAALFTDFHPDLGDFFLAADDTWHAVARPSALCLRRQMELEPGECKSAAMVFGYSRMCSVDWLHTQLEQHSTETVKSAWAGHLESARTRAPELWMQEECLWDAGRLAAFSGCGPGEDAPAIVTGGAPLFASAVQPGRPPPLEPVSDLLALTLPLNDLDPARALASLRSVSSSQASSGRVPEFRGSTCDTDVDPTRDRSDLEIWLLLAWSEYVTVHSDQDVLDLPCPFADGAEAPVWEHLRRAYTWLRGEIREGSHGLIRMLAGDWNGYLNRVGTEGRGESVLNSALTCYALQRLIGIAHHRGDDEWAEEMENWHQKLRIAVGEAFEDFWFRRAYTDAGRPLGARVEDRIFTAVQAWAVLARCGTARERELALTATLEHQQTEPAAAMISRPFALPPPVDVSDMAVLPGERENGGVSMPVTAWFIWALAREGRREQALKEWERFALRRRAAETPDLPAALAANLDFCASGHASRRQGVCGIRDSTETTWLPSAHAVAWQGFALRKIIS